MPKRFSSSRGFTLIELVVTLVLIGALAAFALPRFADLSTQAKISSLENIAGTMRATANIVKATAFAKGLSIFPSNPGDQSALLVETEAGTSEIDWRNLCPESRAELGDSLTMIDFIDLSVSGDLTSQLNNRYTLVGYDIPGFSVPTNQGCYVIYDSFGDPACTVTLVIEDC